MKRDEPLLVLLGCERSQVITAAFRKRGHQAFSCDLQSCYGNFPEYHIQDDLLNVIDARPWDLLIAHPPCTFNSQSSAKWRWHPDDKNLPKQLRRPHPLYPERKEDQQKAIDFFKKLWLCNIPRKCLENPKPLGSLVAQVGNYTQIIQPWQFGDEAQKSTCLWLHNLPRLKPTNIVGKGEFIITKGGRKLPKWYSDAKKSNKDTTQMLRSHTFEGIARGMADQWG